MSLSPDIAQTFSQGRAVHHSAGFQTCRIADFQIAKVLKWSRLRGVETRDTADLEVCATSLGMRCSG